MSPVRVQFDYDVVRSSNQESLATGYTIHASLDPQGRPRRLPDRVQSLLDPEA